LSDVFLDLFGHLFGLFSLSEEIVIGHFILNFENSFSRLVEHLFDLFLEIFLGKVSEEWLWDRKKNTLSGHMHGGIVNKKENRRKEFKFVFIIQSSKLYLFIGLQRQPSKS
jgi:hypothetical protein